mmetsp:Transcript_30821/g.90040  ORF Transcript_30821/g.90040 Transcript_30821/m.90040 type:complete len:516 (+) Transcript_30821:32-1579(+)
MERKYNDEESSWAPEAAPSMEQGVDDGTNGKGEQAPTSSSLSSSNWQPQWDNDNDDEVDRSTANIRDLSDPYDLATPRRAQYAAAVAMAVTPDDLYDLFSVSTASTNQTAKKSNTSHSPSNSTYGSPLDIHNINNPANDDIADDTSSAHFARSPFTVAPITPSSTIMSYSSSNMEGSQQDPDPEHNRNESFATETTMDYDASTVGTSSAVAVLYQIYASSSVAEDTTCTTSGSGANPNLSTDAAAGTAQYGTEGVEATIITRPNDRYIRKGDPGTEWSTPNILSNEDSTVGGGEISVGGVLRLLEEGGDDEASLAPYRKKRGGETNFCAKIRGKKLLLLGIMALATVCLVVGLYVAMPRKRESKSSEARVGQDKEDGEKNIFGETDETQMPSLQPTQPGISVDDPEIFIPVSSSSIPGDKTKDGGDEQSSLDSTNDEPIPLVPSSLPTRAPVARIRSDNPTSTPTPGLDSGSSDPTVVEYCGDGLYGNGTCRDSSLCCSTYGWCGTSPAYCSDRY